MGDVNMPIRLKYDSDGHAEVVQDDEDVPIEERDFRDGTEEPSMDERRRRIGAFQATERAAQKRAFEEFLRVQEAGEARAQAEGTASAGGYVVPDFFTGLFLENLAAADPLFSAARVIETPTGDDTRIPLDDDTSVATQVAENQASVTTSPVVFDAISFTKTPMWRTGMIRVPRELVQDSGFDLSGLLAGVFGRRFARGCGAAFVTQLLSDASVGTTTASPTAILPTEILDLMSSLDSSHSMIGAFLMNESVLTALKKQTAGTSANYPGMLGTDPEGRVTVFGKTVFSSPSMPNATAALKPVAFGRLDRFVVRRVRASLAIMSFPERYAEFLQVGFEGHLRIQAALAKTTNAPAAIKLLAMHA
jgi:HK97 family phage major capsid protein